jgi:dienelactone hydrolase
VVMGFCYGGGKALQYSLKNPNLAGTGVFYGALESDPALCSAGCQVRSWVSLAQKIRLPPPNEWLRFRQLWKQPGWSMK